MKIIVVGAGLGGLTAAYRLARSGHAVQVLERSDRLTPQGGGMNIRPSASRILQSWDLAPDMEHISHETSHTLLRDMKTGDVTMRNIAVDISEFPDWGLRRQDLIQVLYRKALEAGAEVLFGHEIANVEDDAQRAVVMLTDGSRLDADMVLAADGVRSRIRHTVLADVDCAKDPIISRMTLYGVSVDDAGLASRPGTSKLTDQANLNIWMGKDGFVVTRHNPKLKSVGLLFGINSETDQKGLWDEQGDIAFVRQFFGGSCSELVQALEVADSCDRWKLAELPDLPRWTSRAGRILLLGDSAHAMHPNAAQGFSLIIEDIAVLDFLIESRGRLGRKGEPDIPGIAKAWQEIRKPRVERIKAYARWNTAMFSGDLRAPSNDVERRAVKSLKDVAPDMSAKFHSSRFLKWTLDYDAIADVCPLTAPGCGRHLRS